jgi:formylglycine-generating enzyme required for sulfatase activity/tetratricopeptide (TPR) repeat protein
MMERAGRMYGLRTLGLVILVTLISWAGWEGYGRLQASIFLDSIQRADTKDVPALVEKLSGYRRWADPELARVVQAGDAQSRERVNASIALLPVDATQVDYLSRRLSTAAAGELEVLRDTLKPHRNAVTPRLWAILESAQPGAASVLPTASALASYDPDNAKWEAVGGKVAAELVSVSSLSLRVWTEALHPVRGKLIAPIATIFQDKSRSETIHSHATDILTDYASDDPNWLAELLMVSDHNGYLRLFAVAEKRAEQIMPILQAELARKASPWNDPPLDSSWTAVDPAVKSRIEAAQGMLLERFAFCQTMPLDEFLTTADMLRKSGYRPVRCRPYPDGKNLEVAAVWNRDGRKWRIRCDLSADGAREQDARHKKDKFLPVDVAGYVAIDPGGKPADRYAALWAEGRDDDDARMYVCLTADDETEREGKLKEAKLIPRTLHATLDAAGRARYCGVWAKPPAPPISGQVLNDQFQGNFEQNHADRGDQLLVDVVVSAAGKPQAFRERAEAALESAEKKLKDNPDDVRARFSRAMARFRLGKTQLARDDFNTVLARYPESLRAIQYRAIVLARLNRQRDAHTDLAKQQKEGQSASAYLYLAAIVAVELGEGVESAIETLERAMKKQPTDSRLRWDAACAFSLASGALSRGKQAKGRQLRERSLELLRELVAHDDADFGKFDDDVDLDPIRDDPAFAEIMKAGHSDRRYAAVWNSDARFEAVANYGLDPAAHLQVCSERIADGYRPVSWSAARTSPEGPLVTASVWHRPTVAEEEKDRLAERQARAAIGLLRMGEAEGIWPLLGHSSDPRLRSFIVNWLKPQGADPKLIAAELDRIDSHAKPIPAPGQKKMDAILFHPETSMRRALILALGTYGTAGLSPSEREPLVGKLLDLYRDDADAGIHGAAEWTLRKWGQQDQLEEADRRLIKQNDWGERRWSINPQGQTFAVIDGPVGFRMGSPASDAERGRMEQLKQMTIGRRFAIATKEVTVEQFQRFQKHLSVTIDDYLLSGSPNEASPNPHPQSPSTFHAWYTAAHYCNWLSEQEDLREDQWCYVRNGRGEYAEGMSIAPDALERTGYRLPTEAEWEYACRAGAATTRYYGNSITLLDAYAWYKANSKERVAICGSLRPNDLGLFDMLGNVFEWCQNERFEVRKGKKGLFDDLMIDMLVIKDSGHRMLRSGSYGNPPVQMRSAYRIWQFPSTYRTDQGFRLARTLP